MAQAKPIPIALVPPPPAKKGNDRFVIYLAVATLVFLVAGFGAAWYYLKDSPQRMFRSSFVDSGPVVIVVDGWAIATRMSIETDKSDGGWASNNKRAIVGVLQKTLAESDPRKLQTPEGVDAMQSKLKEASNATMGTTKIRSIMFTEFVLKQPV